MRKRLSEIGMTLTPSKRSNGQRVTAIVPIELAKLSCHLVPQFQKIPEDGWQSSDLLDSASYFFLNEYSSHIMMPVFVNGNAYDNFHILYVQGLTGRP